MVVTGESLGAMKRPSQFGVAVGRAYELLRADVQAHVRLCRERIGFRYCRFHGLFHDDMLVAVRDAEGGLHFQWSHVDKVLDFLLSIGMKPFLELGPMPAALVSGSETFFWWRMNVTPPRNFGEWEVLVESFTRHCVRRYGLEEVRSWYFEVWNEPNLRAFWAGTWAQYIELYARASAAVKRVDPELRIGGPASAEAKKVPEFLSDCAQRNLPVDFVSTHVYPQNEWNHYEGESPHRPGEFFGETIREIRRQVPKVIPVFWTEYSSLTARTRADVEWVDNPSIDRLESAAFIVRHAFETEDLSDGMVWWVASDVFEEAGIAQSPFSCTYGLVTIDGIPKASFRAFEMLAQLKGHRLSPSFEGGGRGVDDASANQCTPRSPTPTPPSREGRGVAVFRDGEILRLLAWNDASVAEPQEWSETLQLSLNGPSVATRRLVKAGQGSAFETWVEMGRPQELTPAQLEALQYASQPACRIEPIEPSSGMAKIELRLLPGEIEAIEIAPVSEPAHNRDHYTADVAAWNEALAGPG